MGAKWHNVIYWNSLIKEIVANDAYIQLNRKTNHQSVILHAVQKLESGSKVVKPFN